MELKINGKKKEVSEKLTVEGLLEELEIEKKGRIIVLNQEVVPEEEWKEKELNKGDEIEILSMVGGG